MLRTAIKHKWPFYLLLTLFLLVFTFLFLFFAVTPRQRQLLLAALALGYILWGITFQASSRQLTWNIFLEYFFVAVLAVMLLWPLTLML